MVGGDHCPSQSSFLYMTFISDLVPSPSPHPCWPGQQPPTHLHGPNICPIRTVYPWYPMSAHTFVNSHCVKSSLNILIRVCHSAPRGLQLIKDSYSYSKRSHRSWQGNDCFLKTFSTIVVSLESCGVPAWGSPPMAKVMRKEARHTQRRDRASGVPLEILEHLTP